MLLCTAALSEFEAMVLMAVGYFQPLTRGELSKIFGEEVSRDIINHRQPTRRGFHKLRAAQPDAGRTVYYVTTPHFLSAFGMETLRDLPNIEALEDAGLHSRHAMQNEIAASEGSESETDEESSIIE